MKKGRGDGERGLYSGKEKKFNYLGTLRHTVTSPKAHHQNTRPAFSSYAPAEEVPWTGLSALHRGRSLSQQTRFQCDV
jgi:hypothetical protein